MVVAVKLEKGNILGESPKAVCFDLGIGNTWLPKGQITLVKTADGGDLRVPLWLAQKVGIWGKGRRIRRAAVLLDH